MKNIARIKSTNFRIPLNIPGKYQGGKEVIERLISLFGVRNRQELADILGVSTGTFATWQTRNTTPFELLIRIHLATGVSMEYLVFGEEEENQDVMKFGDPIRPSSQEAQEVARSYRAPTINCYSIENGKLLKADEFAVDYKILKAAGAAGCSTDMIIISGDNLQIVDGNADTAVHGRYLFSINDVYQIGEMRMLPDGKVYLLDNGERYPVNSETTHIHGKVVSVLERC